MANEKITGQVTFTGQANTPGMLAVTIKIRLSSPVNNFSGEEGAGFEVDPNWTETEIQAELQRLVAAYVSDATSVTFTAADVRGCSF